MPVHIGELQSTVQLEDEPIPAAVPAAEVDDEMTQRLRQEQQQRDRARLEAEGYAD